MARKKKMLVNVIDQEEIRIAVTVDGKLDQLYMERLGRPQQAGNIYKGRVLNLEPSLEAAFIDLGGGKNGFLHVSDVIPPDGGFTDLLGTKKKSRRRKKNKNKNKNGESQNGQKHSITELLKEGQYVLVQIAREGIEHKGASLTTYLSLPGRYMVLMPEVPRRGISKKIEDEKQRDKLKGFLQKFDIPGNHGVIIRTAGAAQSAKALNSDLKSLLQLWDRIMNIVKTTDDSGCVYRESDLMIRAVRDIFTDDVDQVIVDSEEAYNRLREFVRAVMPRYFKKVSYYNEKSPLFSLHHIEEEIDKIFLKKVALPSGGNIVIEQTEALISIDVNSARARQQKNIEATAKQTNIEAAAEIARQLRLRDLGGLIIIDFIDMSRKRDRDAVERELQKALASDKAKTHILQISSLGILEMTRQRVRQGVERAVFVDCPVCRGSGIIKSSDSLWLDILRKVRIYTSQHQNHDIHIIMNPNTALEISNKYRHKFIQVEAETGKRIILEADVLVPQGEFRVR